MLSSYTHIYLFIFLFWKIEENILRIESTYASISFRFDKLLSKAKKIENKSYLQQECETIFPETLWKLAVSSEFKIYVSRTSALSEKIPFVAECCPRRKIP